MTSIYVDEAAGSDTTGTGSQDAPYQSLGFAVYTHPTASFLIRKDAQAEYAEPTQSASKKAKKTADGLEKKRKKQEELEAKEKAAKGAEKEKREKLLEESKSIVLTEDASLPKATKVRDSEYAMYHHDLNAFVVQDPQPWPIPIPARPCFRLGASSEAAKGHHLCCIARWDWLSSSCPLGSRRPDLQRSHSDSRILYRAGWKPSGSP